VQRGRDPLVRLVAALGYNRTTFVKAGGRKEVQVLKHYMDVCVRTPWIQALCPTVTEGNSKRQWAEPFGFDDKSGKTGCSKHALEGSWTST